MNTSKSERRAARIAAAQARDAQIVEQATRDPFLVDWLRGSREKDPGAFQKALALAEREAARPSSPDHARALVALGGLRALQADDAERAARAAAAQTQGEV